MGAWRRAGVWLGLVEDEDDRIDEDELDEEFAVPVRSRTVRPAPRGPDRSEVGRASRRDDRADRTSLFDQADRTARDEHGARLRELRTDRSDGSSRTGQHFSGYDDSGYDEQDDFERRAGGRALRTEHGSEVPHRSSGSRLTRLPDPRSEEPRASRSTVRPLLRPTAGSTALSVPGPDMLANAPQVNLRERASADDRLTRRYEITTLHPTSYSDARVIGEQFRDGHPVIMNLTELPEADAKRLVDFAAGLAFGLRGSMERVTNRVFLLTPPNIRVSDEDKQRIADTGFFDRQ